MRIQIFSVLSVMVLLPVSWLVAQQQAPRVQETFSTTLPPTDAIPATIAITTNAVQDEAEMQQVQGFDLRNANNAEGSMYFAPFIASIRFDQDDRAAMELARKYRISQDEKAKDEIRAELRAVTTKTFEKRMEARARQLEEAQKKLNEIKAELDQRRELAEKIIARRITDLLDDPDPYAWELPAVGAQSLPPQYLYNSGSTPRADFRYAPAQLPGLPASR